MSQLFPPEILNYSAEGYYNKLSLRSKVIFTSTLLFVALIIAALPFIRVDVTTQSRGVVRTPFENTLIQSVVYAEISSYNLTENKLVAVGDTLIVLNSDKLDEQIIIENQKNEENVIFAQDILYILQSRDSIQSPKYKSEYKRYLSKIREQNTLIQYLEKEYETAKKLYEKSVVSEFDFLQQKNNLDKANSSLTFLKDEYLSNWQSEKTRLELENQTLQSNINQLEKEKRQYIITAPVSGVLVQVAGFQAGNFIVPNQSLAYISSSDSLLAECYILPKDIGYLSNGQSVAFQIDAFNYREWGMIKGEITEILNDVVDVQNKPFFRVRCKLQHSCLQLQNGYQGCLKKGMTLTGRFHLNRRSLWQLLFDKVDDWMNPKVMKENL